MIRRENNIWFFRLYFRRIQDFYINISNIRGNWWMGKMILPLPQKCQEKSAQPADFATDIRNIVYEYINVNIIIILFETNCKNRTV